MSRTTDLMVNIYGNDKSAGKTLKGVGKDADRAGEQFKRMGKVAAASFLAVGTAAVAFAASAAKAAVEDQKSQKMLAASLKNTAKATDAQVKSTEDFITKMQLTYGIADDKLRPAFATLTRATGDLTESQNLMQVAMNVSSATGKDLSSVSLALAKAHNGNIGALTRLGIPLDKAIVKNKDFTAALQVLTKTFTGAAKAGADTFAGRMAILQQRMNEAKEQIGYALMPMLEKMAKYLTDTVVPNVQAFVDGLTGVKNSSGKAYKSIYDLGEQIRSVVDWLSKHTWVIKVFAAAIASIYVVGKVASVVGAISTITAAYGRLATSAAAAAEAQAASAAAGAGGVAGAAAGAGVAARIAGLLKFAPLAGLSLASKEGYKDSTTDAKLAKDQVQRMQKMHNWTDKQAKDWAHKNHLKGYASGGAVSGGTQIMVGENGPELFTPSSSGTITPHNRLGRVGGVNVVPDISGGKDYSVQPPGKPHRAVGGSVARGTQIMVGENGPELFTPTSGGSITPNNRLGSVGGTTGVDLNGTDPAVALAKYKLTQLNRSEGKNGLVWFNGYQQFERPFMHSVKNQPLFGSHTTAPGTDRFGYRALGGAVARGASYIVGERGPELLTMGANNGFVTPNNRLGGMGGTTVVVNVAGSVIHEKDLAVTVRDNIAQLMRRRGLNPAILGV